MSALSKLNKIISKFESPQPKHKKEGEEPKTKPDSNHNHQPEHHLSITCTQTQLPGWTYSFDISNILFSKKSKYQDIKIVSSPVFDTALLIDGNIQSSTRDEFIYHESLVHPAMMSHPNPQRVFIGGGGECATAREVLRYQSVQELIVCDIDEEISQIAEKHLPSMYGTTGSDKRCKIVIEDAVKFLEEYDGQFDVIILDIVDPTEVGPGIACYFKEFYQVCREKLSEHGIMAVQSTACDLYLHHEAFTVIVNTLKSVFNEGVVPYSAYVPSFYAEWGYCLVFKRAVPDWFHDAQIIDGVLQRKLGTDGVDALRHYDGETHMKMVHLPKWLRKAIEKEDKRMTKNSPHYTYQ
eukprot:CAMPEP_0197043706 /NCGR_PEP_ID=MMETSP1384-20130603/19907_1 /TAXON_ID=29189 /ORGANISM="Ammonia sp." /LENGTH=351 /DNA_ID=CAMNT_0042475047 /DNA_START=76 /DNA_END=1131 /DNA_ORIENTATION=+